VLVERDGDITIKEKEFRDSEVLWELLTRKRVNKEYVTSEDLRKYEKILLLTNAHLEGISLEESLMSAEGKNSAKLSPAFREAQRPGCRIRVTPCMKKILRCPPGHNITIRPNQQLLRL